MLWLLFELWTNTFPLTAPQIIILQNLGVTKEFCEICWGFLFFVKNNKIIIDSNKLLVATKGKTKNAFYLAWFTH